MCLVRGRRSNASLSWEPHAHRKLSGLHGTDTWEAAAPKVSRKGEGLLEALASFSHSHSVGTATDGGELHLSLALPCQACQVISYLFQPAPGDLRRPMQEAAREVGRLSRGFVTQMDRFRNANIQAPGDANSKAGVTPSASRTQDSCVKSCTDGVDFRTGRCQPGSARGARSTPHEDGSGGMQRSCFCNDGDCGGSGVCMC